MNSHVSVVIASYNSLHTIEACLASLDRQTVPPRQTIVIDSGSDGAASLIAASFPHVLVVTSHRRLYPGDARNLGMQHASSPLIAFLDADCIAFTDWIAAFQSAHQSSPEPIIGGVVDNANPGDLTAWARYFCEFSQWIPGTPPGPVPDIPTCNLSLKSWAFARFGPFLEGSYCSDTAFNWRAASQGHPPRFHPSIRIAHIHPTRLLPFLAKQKMHGRAFAAMRLSERNPGWVKIALLGLACPALPLLLYVRIFRRILRSRSALRDSTYSRAFVASSPAVLLGLAAWSWGEWLGYRSGLAASAILLKLPRNTGASA